MKKIEYKTNNIKKLSPMSPNERREYETILLLYIDWKIACENANARSTRRSNIAFVSLCLLLCLP